MDYPISQIPSKERQNYIASMSLVVRSDARPEGIVPDLKRAFEGLDRTLPCRTPESMEDVIAVALTLRPLENWLFGSFAILGVDTV